MSEFGNGYQYLKFLERKVIPELEKCKYHASYSLFRKELRDKRYTHLRKGIVFWSTGHGWRLHKDAKAKLDMKFKKVCCACGKTEQEIRDKPWGLNKYKQDYKITQCFCGCKRYFCLDCLVCHTD